MVAWATFPGVIVHELAHALFCRLFGLEIYEVVYFRFVMRRSQPVGYVLHSPAPHAWQNIMVSIAPFFVNSIVGAVIGASAAIPILQFNGGDAWDYFQLWLGVSIAMHAFPSTGDAGVIWHAIREREVPLWAKALGMPLIGFIYVGAIGSIFWLNAIYGIAVAGFLPNLIIKLFA